MPSTISLDTTQRQLIVVIAIAALILIGVVIADLAIGGRADPPTLRAAAITLNGPWRFHIGDDPSWSNTNIDDTNWETIDMTAKAGSHDSDVGLPDYVGGWMAHGHPNYHGYAWYRRVVTVPAGSAWEVLGPTLVEHGYELYWNGQRLGGSGKLDTNPHVVGTRPMRFALPSDASGSHGVLAIRVYMLPGSSSADGGGMHSAPILAPLPTSDQLHRVQWQRTIAGYIVEVVEPIAMFAVIGLIFVYRLRSTQKGFLIFASIALVLMAERRLNNAIVAWTDLMDLTTYAWLASVMWVLILAAWTLAWNRWCVPRWRSIDVLALALAVIESVASLLQAKSVIQGSRIASIALFVVIGVRIVRSGPLRVMALLSLASVMAALFGTELLDTIGVPGIWFPFGIGVSRTQYVYAIVIPLLALLAVMTLRTRTDE